MSIIEYEKNAKVFKAFCDENRLMILELLQTGEKCACKLLEDLNIGQSTLSHHMKILCDSGVVNARKEGKWTHYSISEEGSAYAKELLDKITKLYSTVQECSCR
ncbi:transcriptional regulator, ArsR family [[Clostridium] saccharolyticum WM1]|uniref:Transcriptional regulator, ArsR family n=1 Tax=Lacrimispora saccharolytica (strain ATCC 35040 / DSM 2544 / NRCC 2533 / WM1) TaxID=610130 RepID=D9R5W4_LACSW|nr:metalloregulator ArsR/SmtB family transcription factor [Lacrimispora saccharolytica]ADL05297.1 transcriptional regulator, ArsR family [[Clostridium] saccharolyticum WM1]